MRKLNFEDVNLGDKVETIFGEVVTITKKERDKFRKEIVHYKTEEAVACWTTAPLNGFKFLERPKHG